jgi:iron(III) transport system permease protein
MSFRRRRVSVWLLLFVLLILALFGYPLVMLVYGALRTGQPGAAGEFSLDGFITGYGDPETWRTLWNSIMYATGVQIIGLVGGFVFAWLSTRTNTPGRQLIPAVMLIMFAVPSLFFAISWGMFTSPTGLLTKWTGFMNDGSAIFDAQSWGGLILVSGFKSVALYYLLLIGPVRALNKSMEEAGRLSGAPRWKLFVDINSRVWRFSDS